jgi:hypothetical protein
MPSPRSAKDPAFRKHCFRAHCLYPFGRRAPMNARPNASTNRSRCTFPRDRSTRARSSAMIRSEFISIPDRARPPEPSGSKSDPVLAQDDTCVSHPIAHLVGRAEFGMIRAWVAEVPVSRHRTSLRRPMLVSLRQARFHWTYRLSMPLRWPPRHGMFFRRISPERSSNFTIWTLIDCTPQCSPSKNSAAGDFPGQTGLQKSGTSKRPPLL